jgi:uncharacterized protein (TIGR00297 family)
MQPLTGLVLAAVIAYLARLARSLSRDGAIAAACVGTVVFGFGGWQWAVLLLVFFVSSSALSQSLRGRSGTAEERYAKGSRRDAGQVLGNGAVAAVWVAVHVAVPESRWPWFGYAAALAAVTADTWATELGALSPTAPRIITHLGTRVSRGTSGAVSALGTLAGLVGAAIIVGLAAMLLPLPVGSAAWIVLLGGSAGAVFDSILGATVQCLYSCPMDGLETEQHPLHRCGTRTQYKRGWPWLNNDWVNAACSAFGSLVACVLAFALGAR